MWEINISRRLHFFFKKMLGNFTTNSTTSAFSGPNYKLWEAAYYLFGCIFLIFAVVYCILALKDIIAEGNNTAGQFAGQIVYIIAVFVKGIGLFTSGVFISMELYSKHFSHDKTGPTYWDVFSVLPGGLPGYVSAAAYCLIFFSWCSVCYSSLERSSVGFYHRSRYIIIALLTFIALGAVISFGFMCYSVSNPQYKVNDAHLAEAVVASARDFILAFFFIIYLYKIYKLFETPCPRCDSPETRLFTLCVLLIMALFLRPFCSLIYNYIFSSKNTNASEFSVGYFFVFLVEFLLTEILPLGMIGLLRLLSQDAYTTPSDENVAAFLALD